MEWPVPRPSTWLEIVNQPESEAEVAALCPAQRPFWGGVMDAGHSEAAAIGVVAAADRPAEKAAGKGVRMQNDSRPEWHLRPNL